MNRRNFLNKLTSTAYLLPIFVTTLSSAKDIVLPNDKSIKLPNITTPNRSLYLESKDILNMNSVRGKLKAVQSHVGYGNFNIISFDSARSILKRTKNMKDFTKAELDFIEFLFYYKPESHGFYGSRTSDKLSFSINKKDVTKIPNTGHYLFNGKALDTYTKIEKDLGSNVILTSGVRSIVKQMKLFLDKMLSVKYDLALASRSIAPPAFTYHVLGDFDIGKKGFGTANFTERFALTEEFKAMKKLKYIDMRYTINNKDGVRYEPWHIKII